MVGYFKILALRQCGDTMSGERHKSSSHMPSKQNVSMRQMFP